MVRRRTEERTTLANSFKLPGAQPCKRCSHLAKECVFEDTPLRKVKRQRTSSVGVEGGPPIKQPEQDLTHDGDQLDIAVDAIFTLPPSQPDSPPPFPTTFPLTNSSKPTRPLLRFRQTLAPISTFVRSRSPFSCIY